jgi:divalent metal cation (Fe/Co/Zn/Cd) transporter
VTAAPAPALRRAARLCALTVAWNTLVGGTAVATAISTGSLSLIGFGINAVVDSSASAVLIWRFRAEEAGHPERAQHAEWLALRLAGTAFLVIAVYLFIQATRALIEGRHYEATVFGILEALAALLVLPLLARAKYSLSKRLGSSALRADSLLTWSGVALASLALIALLAQRLLGWWWVDPIGALCIVVAFTLEGSRAVRGRGLAAEQPLATCAAPSRSRITR